MRNTLANILKNTALAQLPQGTVSRAAMMGLGAEKPFLAMVPDAARQIAEEEALRRDAAIKEQQAFMEQQQQMGQQAILSQLIGGGGFQEGAMLPLLMSAGMSAKDAAALANSYTQSRYDQGADFREVIDEEGNITYEPTRFQGSLTERNRDYIREKSEELDKSATSGKKMIEEIGLARQAFEKTFESSFPGARPGEIFTLVPYGQTITNILSGKDAKVANALITKVKNTLFNQLLNSLNNAGATRLAATIEAEKAAIPGRETPIEAAEILFNLAEKAARFNELRQQYMREWRKYNPRDYHVGMSQSIETLDELLSRGDVSPNQIDMEKLVKRDIAREYGAPTQETETESFIIRDDINDGERASLYSIDETQYSDEDIMRELQRRGAYGSQ